MAKDKALFDDYLLIYTQDISFEHLKPVPEPPGYKTLPKRKSPDAILLKTAWGQSFNRPDLN